MSIAHLILRFILDAIAALALVVQPAPVVTEPVATATPTPEVVLASAPVATATPFAITPPAAVELIADLKARRADHAAWLRTDGRNNPYGYEPARFLQGQREIVSEYDLRITVVERMAVGDCSGLGWLMYVFADHRARHREWAAYYAGNPSAAAAAGPEVELQQEAIALYDWRMAKATELCS